MFLSYYLMMYRICLKWKEINKGFFYEQTNIFKYQDFDRFKDNQTYLDFMNNVLNSYYSVIEAHINTEIDEFMLLVSSTDNSLIQMMISAQKVD